jgi:ornithine decarboxylase
MVIGTRTSQPAGQEEQHEYWISDGLYGSMNCLLYDHAVLSAHPLVSQPEALSQPSTVFGPTCDGLDVVLKDYPLPKLGYGDFIVFEKLGAYSFAGVSDFNGMGLDDSNIRYVFSVLP